jgi:sortase A
VKVGSLLGDVALGLGVLLLAWAAVTVLWKEPITSYQAHGAQERLQQQLELRSVLPVRASLDFEVPESQPAGRISIPSIGVSAVFVEGIDEDVLKTGPGHYPTTHWPGQGKVIAIAGHRTTYGAWFRHIDKLDQGDRIILTMPYGRYVFRVADTEIVDDADWSILQGKGEFLVLSACHPLYSAAQRLVVTAQVA